MNNEIKEAFKNIQIRSIIHDYTIINSRSVDSVTDSTLVNESRKELIKILSNAQSRQIEIQYN